MIEILLICLMLLGLITIASLSHYEIEGRKFLKYLFEMWALFWRMLSLFTRLIFTIAILSSIILGGWLAFTKVNTIDEYLNSIPPELFDPASITQKSKNELSSRLNDFECSSLKPTNLDGSWTQLICGRDRNIEWLESTNFAASYHSAHRGRYIHHYSTIIFPFMLIKAGHHFELFASHYGAASIIPLLALSLSDQSITFHSYNTIGYFAVITLALVGLLVFLLFARQHLFVTSIAALVFVTWSFAINAGALSISPGFSVFRLLPTTVLALIFVTKPNSYLSFLVFLIVALINSVSLNLLLFVPITLICFLPLFDRLFGNQPENQNTLELRLAAGLFFVLLIQFLIAQFSVMSTFDQAVGSYLGAGQRSLLGIIRSVLLLNLVGLIFFVVAFFYGDKNQLRQTTKALLIHCCLSLYSLRFHGSPQHYAGFLFLTGPLIGYMAYIAPKSRLQLLVPCSVALAFYLNLSTYSYATLNGFSSPVSAPHHTPVTIGTELKFPVSDDIQRTDNELKLLADEAGIERAALFSSAFFAVRSKSHLEIFKNLPLKPYTYDFYTTLPNIDEDGLKKIVEAYPYLVTLSDQAIDNRIYFLNKLQAVLNNSDFKAHLLVLRSMKRLNQNVSEKKKFCSEIYCIRVI